jgi:restriction system protein
MYEEIIAAILMDMGCDVQLTTATKDGGRDILAAFQTPFGKLLTIVECKRYKPERKIGIDLVERFLWVVDRNDKASFGLIATTSFFSADAQVIANNYRYRLKLKDFYDIREWIGKYGSWTKDDNSEIWIPETYSTPKKADAGDGK